MRKPLIAAASLFALGAIAAAPASAIDCEGNFQVQRNGNLIATPFCQDGNLAVVAREYGMNVRARDIRYNPSVKARACRFVGSDNRVRDTCSNYLDRDRGNFIWD
jgi:hypothetical protein